MGRLRRRWSLGFGRDVPVSGAGRQPGEQWEDRGDPVGRGAARGSHMSRRHVGTVVLTLLLLSATALEVGASLNELGPPGSAICARRDEKAVLVNWGTYLGGTRPDAVSAAVCGPSGSIFVCGSTESPGFPTTTGAYRRTFQGGNEVFVAKLSANGDSLLWSTFLGGSQTERSADIALAPDGGVIVAGETYSFDFPFTHDSQAYVDYGDAFVAKLSADGVSLVYSRLLGGSDWDGCHALAVNLSSDTHLYALRRRPDLRTLPPAN